MLNKTLVSVLFLGLIIYTHQVHAETDKTGNLRCNITTKSQPRDIDYSWMSKASWYQQHVEDINIADKGEIDLLFIGDSITAAWPYETWSKQFKPLKAANFAIGGDTTHNLLWRLQHGNAHKLSPKVINVLIGVNNMGLKQETPHQAYCGMIELIHGVERLYPQAKILVNQLLPWGETPSSDLRRKVDQVNLLLAHHHFSSQVTLFQFGQELLDQRGYIPKSLMADFLHPTKAGYEIYAQHLLPEITTLLSKSE